MATAPNLARSGLLDSIDDWMQQRTADVQRLAAGAHAAGQQVWADGNRVGHYVSAARPSDVAALGLRAIQQAGSPVRSLGGLAAAVQGEAASRARSAAPALGRLAREAKDESLAGLNALKTPSLLASAIGAMLQSAPLMTLCMVAIGRSPMRVTMREPKRWMPMMPRTIRSRGRLANSREPEHKSPSVAEARASSPPALESLKYLLSSLARRPQWARAAAWRALAGRRSPISNVATGAPLAITPALQSGASRVRRLRDSPEAAPGSAARRVAPPPPSLKICSTTDRSPSTARVRPPPPEVSLGVLSARAAGPGQAICRTRLRKIWERDFRVFALQRAAMGQCRVASPENIWLTGGTPIPISGLTGEDSSNRNSGYLPASVLDSFRLTTSR